VTPDRPVCALDPGARSFQVLYSPEGVIKFQHNRELLDRLHKKLDHLQSLRSKKWIRSNNYKRIRQKIYCKIGWIVDQIHYSTINELKHYNHILLPTFESQELVSKNRLRSKTNRELMSLQHYTFKQRLKSSLYFQKDTKLYIVSEAYTSKTCTRCGVLNDVGSNEIYRCKECGLVIDRDISGARNILLRNICSI
jgi:putative transposase